MDKERMTTKTVDICTCGIVMHQCEADDYDTLGSDSGACCPDCGNEAFATIAELQAENKRLRELLRRLEIAETVINLALKPEAERTADA